MVVFRVPSSTYRLQFNRSFRFSEARPLIAYLSDLGISDLYASPLFQACPGSSHCYDVINTCAINAEIGSEEEFNAMVAELKSHQMGLLQDIVPNHMATSVENRWWMDVLENGTTSRYASYFDINWSPPFGGLKNQVVLPVLDTHYYRALENQEITMQWEEHGFFIHYRGLKFPLSPRSYEMVLSYRLEEFKNDVGSDHPAFQSLLRVLELLQSQRPVKSEVWSLHTTSPEIRRFMNENLRIFNGIKGDPESFNLLDRLLAAQAYRLSYWRTATEKINYRRFFNVSNLIGIRVEDPVVFEATHELVLQLIEQGKITGLRIDHIDGLLDPLEYLRRVERRPAADATETKKPFFHIVVEKILMGDETLPEDWPVSGTTGYDFLNVVNGVFVDAAGVSALDSAYQQLIGSKMVFQDVVYQKKKEVMAKHFSGELLALEYQLRRLATQDRHGRDLPMWELRRALEELTACLPVYRTYSRKSHVSFMDREFIEHALVEARRRQPTIDDSAFHFLRRVLLLQLPLSATEAEMEAAWLRFVMQWQQLTGPIMAKGVEDTALYVYNRLISLNEVGSDPEAHKISVTDFHNFNLKRQQYWPYTLNATSTHDTKRSEDVRARINVLSEIPDLWEERLNQWQQWNSKKKRLASNLYVPGNNEEALLYQTLLGAWPLYESEVAGFKQRLKDYMIKAVREEKVHTRWTRTNRAYEDALMKFIGSILEAGDDNPFLNDFLLFQKRVAFYGALNSLGQVLLKIASPGIPDFYQGAELWNLSLVDPDNRRPVNFQKRTQLLAELRQKGTGDRISLARELFCSWQDSRIKLYLTSQALHFRRRHQAVFRSGAYIPLQASGKKCAPLCVRSQAGENLDCGGNSATFYTIGRNGTRSAGLSNLGK